MVQAPAGHISRSLRPSRGSDVREGRHKAASEWRSGLMRASASSAC